MTRIPLIQRRPHDIVDGPVELGLRLGLGLAQAEDEVFLFLFEEVEEKKQS